MSNPIAEIGMLYDDFVKLNDLLRSCHSVAKRQGAETNWEALQTKLETFLLMQQKHCPEGVMRLDAFATARTFRFVDETTPVSLTNERNSTNTTLQAAIAANFDEVYFVGIKNGMLSAGWSGFNNLQDRLGALDILKHDMLVRGN